MNEEKEGLEQFPEPQEEDKNDDNTPHELDDSPTEDTDPL